MGKPFWCHTNQTAGATITSKEPNPLFPSSVLSQPEFNQYRTLDRALRFDGIDKHCEVVSHSDFEFSTSFEIEMVATPQTITPANNITFLEKGSGLFNLDGYGLHQQNANLNVKLSDGVSSVFIITDTTPLVVGESFKVNAIYDGSGTPSVEIWFNGVNIATATNADQDGCILTGTIPASLAASSAPLKIGYDGFGIRHTPTDISSISAKSSPGTGAAWLIPTDCAFYYKFQTDVANPVDSSGNGHTLTGTNISASDYIDYTGNQWIQSIKIPGISPDTMVIDDRHNMETGAKVSLWRSGTSTGSRVSIGSATVVKGKPIVITDISTSASDTFVIEITDDNNLVGYIKLFKIYLGNKSDMARSFLLDYGSGKKVVMIKNSNSSGNVSKYPTTGELMTYSGIYRVDAADKAILEAVFSDSNNNLSVVFCPDIDDKDTDTIFVDVLNAEAPDFKKESKVKDRIAVNIIEKGIGLQ